VASLGADEVYPHGRNPTLTRLLLDTIFVFVENINTFAKGGRR